jgi:hypothetical protein
MKKYISPLILVFLLLSPFSLESKHLFIKMSFGLFTGGKVDDTWKMDENYYDAIFTEAASAKPGMDISLEFIYQIHQNFSLALGTGYASRRVRGQTGHFMPVPGTDPLGDFFLYPEIGSNIYSFYLTTIFSFPVMSSLQCNFFGGVGYYTGNIKGDQVADEDVEYYNPHMVKNRLIWKFKCSSHTVGLHVGTGIDLELPQNSIFSFEVFYRFASFKKFKTSVQRIRDGVTEILARSIGETGEDLGEDSTFFYAQKIRNVDLQRDIDYLVSQFNYSGFTFRTGIKFRF